MAGVAGAAAGQDLSFSTTTPTPSFVTCGQGCQCLWEVEAQSLFGMSYAKCSNAPCGQGRLVEVMQNKYCFRAQQPKPALQPGIPGPVASTGSLSISSLPSGASVTLDGQYRGTTPVTIPDLSPGYHNLRLSLSGYKDSTQSPSVSTGSVTALSIPLVPVSGQPGQGDQVSVVQLEDPVSVIQLAEERDKLNPQPEPPSPADRIKLNPQPEPPIPPSGGFFDSIISFFTGLFGGNVPRNPPTLSQAGPEATPTQQLMEGSGCLGQGMKICNGQCVNLQSDPDNCGACNTKCPSPKVCSKGRCVTTCENPLKNCNRHCADLQTDKDNCGTCGKKCDAGQSCSGGTCKSLFASVELVDGKSESLAKAVGDTEFRRITQDIGQKNVAEKDLAAAIFHIKVSAPQADQVITQGDTAVIVWDKTNINNYKEVIIELFKEDGTHVTDIAANIANAGNYEWKTKAFEAGGWPMPDVIAIRDNAGRSYLKISTPDGKYTGNSPVFVTKTNEPTSGVTQGTTTLPIEVKTFVYDGKEGSFGGSSYGTFIVGYSNGDVEWPFADIHYVYRGWVKVDVSNLDKNVKKATLHLEHIGTSKNTETATSKQTALHSIWIMQGAWPGFVDMAQTPAKLYIGPGTNQDKVQCKYYESGGCPYDVIGTIDVDITPVVNNWILQKKYSAETGALYYPELLFVGLNEAQEDDNNDRFESQYLASVTVET